MHGNSGILRVKKAKSLLLLIGLPFVACVLISRGCRDMARPVQSEPLVISAENFARDYHQEAWLTVDGRWASEHAWVSPVPNSKYNDSTSVFVPVVPADWKPADAVHVIAVFNEPSSGEAQAWAENHADQHGPVTGTIAPEGAWDYRKMFPSLAVTEPIVFIYVGQAPRTDGGKFDFWFGVGVAVISGFLIFFRVALPLARNRAT